MICSTAVVDELQACVADGGPFALGMPWLVIGLLALLVFWMFRSVTRELYQRTDLSRIRDLVIEGSLGQAILISDKRSRDDVLAVCRAGIVTVQSGGRLGAAFDKIQAEAAYRFGGTKMARFRVLVAILLASLPAVAAGGGVLYAQGVVQEAGAEATEGEREALLVAARMDPAFSCPVELGGAGVLLLLIPAAVIGWLEIERRSPRTRDRAIATASMYAEMASRVVDPGQKVYAKEREKEQRRAG